MPRPKKNKALYSISLKVNDQEFSSEGETLEEAINGIKIEPTRGVLKIYTNGVITVRKGDKEVARHLVIRQMSRLFGEASKIGKEIAMVKATRLIETLLKDERLTKKTTDED